MHNDNHSVFNHIFELKFKFKKFQKKLCKIILDCFKLHSISTFDYYLHWLHDVNETKTTICIGFMMLMKLKRVLRLNQIKLLNKEDKNH